MLSLLNVVGSERFKVMIVALLYIFWTRRDWFVAIGLISSHARFNWNALQDYTNNQANGPQQDADHPQFPAQWYRACKSAKEFHYYYLKYDCGSYDCHKDPIVENSIKNIDLIHLQAVYFIKHLIIKVQRIQLSSCGYHYWL